MNLSKGEKLSLKKDNPSLTKVKVGAGWDIADGNDSYDLDLSAVLVDANGKVDGGLDNGVIFFNHQKGTGIQSMGDNLTGVGEGDDEVIEVDLAALPTSVEKVAFIVNIFDAVSKGQDFGKVNNSFVRVVDANGDKELARYNLQAEYAGKSGVVVATLERSGGEWNFTATGEGVDGSIEDMIKAKGWA